jgi:hypothetical protein
MYYNSAKLKQISNVRDAIPVEKEQYTQKPTTGPVLKDHHIIHLT